ncbi:MAG: hypothetical protein AAF961_12285, partial [Planctomycetota bacterium]
ITVNSVRLVNPGVAIEDGVSRSTLSENESPKLSQYTAVHVRQGDAWSVASVRSRAPESLPPRSRLEGLSWLLGDWIDESPGLIVRSSFAWDDSGAYMLHRYEIEPQGAAAIRGVERIGWDPLRKAIRSWAFDSAGGYLQSEWTKTPDGWQIRSQGYRADGASASSEQAIKRLGDERLEWMSRDRVVGDQPLADADLLLVKRPPKPVSASDVDASE